MSDRINVNHAHKHVLARQAYVGESREAAKRLNKET